MIANIGNQDVYQTPPGYFDTLADQVMNHIKTEQFSSKNEGQEDLPSLMNKDAKETPFSAPAGYFEGFAEKMMARIKTTEAGSVSEELETLSPLLSRIDKKMPFSIPVGYFDDLAENMTAGTKAIEFVNEELENLSPMMSRLKNKNVYETPAGYFDGLANTVLAKIKQQPQQAKVISINKKRSWLKYAVAAAVIGVIATSSILFFNRTVSSGNDPIQNLSKVSDQEMMNYLENQTTPAISADASNSIASADINEVNAKDLLSEIPDDELQQYIDEHANSKDLIN